MVQFTAIATLDATSITGTSEQDDMLIEFRADAMMVDGYTPVVAMVVAAGMVMLTPGEFMCGPGLSLTNSMGVVTTVVALDG